MSAIFDEYKQMDDLRVFKPIHCRDLSQSQNSQVLNAIDLIKQKQCGKIKGRTVADRRKQRDIYTKSQTSSPTLSLDGFITSLMIDAAEERHVATADVAGVFLKAEMDDFVVVKLQGPAVGALININKERYSTHVLNEKGKVVLYVRLLKAMYCALKAPLLWYTLFAKTLRENSFGINPYDKCVASKTINGSQFTICWYVDDIKFSHKDKNVVVEEVTKIEKKIDKMTTTCGNKHMYLGMNLEIKGKAIIMEMKEYLEDCIQDFPEKIDTAAKTPSTKTLQKLIMNH